MKKMTCEMCGGTDLIKQDGVFVCQSCGCKYSPEEARKIMIEGPVDISGSTVKIDNSAFVEKYLSNARRALDKEDWEEVEKYYNLVEQNDPSNIEAIFYSAYGKARLSMVDSDIYKRKQICDVLCNCISVVDDNYNIEKSEENKNIVAKMHVDLFAMYGTNFVYTEKIDGYGNHSDNTSETFFLFAKMAFSFIESVENIIKIDNQIIYWKIIYEHKKYLVGNTSITVNARNKFRAEALELGNKIHEMDPSFEIETIAEAKEDNGCYVATAVYGSYDCPQVWVLRRFRDYTLAETWYGRLFIKFYYATSPTIVKYFGKNKLFVNIFKPMLDRLVLKLRLAGVLDTPYKDKSW